MNDWQVYEKHNSNASVYDTIDDEIAVAIAPSFNMYLSHKLMRMLNQADCILILTNDSFPEQFAIKATFSNDPNGYKIQNWSNHSKGTRKVSNGHSNVSPVRFIKSKGLEQNTILIGKFDNGLAVFNIDNNKKLK